MPFTHTCDDGAAFGWWPAGGTGTRVAIISAINSDADRHDVPLSCDGPLRPTVPLELQGRHG